MNVYNLVTNWVVAGGGSASLTVSVTGSGTVTSNPAGINCPSTCSQTFAGRTAGDFDRHASGGSNWVFSGWSGACSGAGPCTVTMTAAQSVTATFVQGYTLSVNVSGSGTVTSSPSGMNCPSTCSDGYASNTSVTLTATPASGWSFSGWSFGIATGGLGTPCSTAGAGPCTVLMNTATSVTAIFTQSTYPLSVSLFGSGTVTSSPSGIACGATCSSSFLSGIQVTLTATPAQGAVFNGWGGVCSGTGNCVVTMNAAANVSAAFSGNGAPQATQTWVSAASGEQLQSMHAHGALPDLRRGAGPDRGRRRDRRPRSRRFRRRDHHQGDQHRCRPGGESAAVSPGTSGIVISAGSSDAINLRGLTFDGLGATGMSGVVFNSGARLHIQNCLFQGFATAGIAFAPGAGSAGVAQLSIDDATIIGNATGIWIKPTGGIAANVALDRVDIVHNDGEGLRVDGTGGSGAINVAIADSYGELQRQQRHRRGQRSGQRDPGRHARGRGRERFGRHRVESIERRHRERDRGQLGAVGNNVAAQATGGAGLLSYSNNQVTGNVTNGSFTATASLH